ncbi:hypothetical protein [Acrocarpospora sp. B8E8]|uniref:hypothetical protein n=1 Tax=Acrocarpospora sp. B8E8 TaxID=3153572 RepID=UPI00325FC0D9
MSDQRHAAQAREIENHRADNMLRERLISHATEAPSALYLAMQHYWRAKEDGISGDDLAPYRERLDAQYLRSRQQGLVLEHLLRLYFIDSKPRVLCHRVMDLLTIRYFQLVRVGGASAKLREINSGDDHAGLSAEELASGPKVLDRYRASIDELVDVIARSALDRAVEGNGNG